MKSGSSLLPLLQPVNIHMLTIYEKNLSILNLIYFSRICKFPCAWLSIYFPLLALGASH